MALIAGSLAFIGYFAASSGATAADSSIKICKVWTASSIANATGPFTFLVTGSDSSTRTVSVDIGKCALPIPTDSSVTYTITETPEQWYQATAITELDNLNTVSGVDLTAGSATVNPIVGNETVVQYTNDLVTGYAEICKSSPSGSTLAGPFSFDLTNTNAELSGSGGLLFDIPVTVPVGACSGAIEVPAGVLETTEAGTNLYVSQPITATLDGNPANDELLYQNQTDGAAESIVVPSADSSQDTVITYTNDAVNLEVCKVYDGDLSNQPQGLSTTYSFTETASNAAGDTPATAPSPFTLKPGDCSLPTAYAPGTVVTITEAATPGTEVRSISASGAETVVSSYPDVPNRTEKIIIGTSTTDSAPSDSAIVTFTDGLAYPSTLKICKTTPDVGSGPFTFTVAGPQYVSGFPGLIADGSFTVSVPANECEVASIDLPYNSTQTVTESGTSNFMATAISSNFTNVSLWFNGAWTQTTEPVLSNVNLGSVGGTSSADVTMSEGSSETIVTWTNTDPAPTVTPPVTVPNPGVNAGTTTAPTLSDAKVISHQLALTRYEHSIAKLRKEITAIEKSLRSHKLTKATRKAELKRLQHLRAQRLHYLLLIRKVTA